MQVTWIGHATVLVQTQGLNILTDPIWSERASPFSFVGPRRVRAPGVRFEDLPRIDLVLVSHNHYDHMDLPTLRRLWERDRPLIVTSLGNDTILRGEGIESVTRDWGGRVPGPRPGDRGDRRAQPSLGLALGHRPQPRALVGLHDRDARRQHLLRRRHRLGRRRLGARGGARTGPSGSRSCRSAPICRATSCRTAMSAPRRRCASSRRSIPPARSPCTGARSSSPSRRSTIPRAAWRRWRARRAGAGPLHRDRGGRDVQRSGPRGRDVAPLDPDPGRR